MKLTKKQKEFLGYISLYRDEWGQSPSFDEICSHFGFNSYNTVTTYLKILERKGYIRLPDKKNRKRAVEIISPVEVKRFEFPLLGKVAAGKPIEAVENPDVIEVPPERGETVVALINNEATVKKYYKNIDHVELRPAHGDMESILVKEGELRIEGKVVGVIRYYK